MLLVKRKSKMKHIFIVNPASGQGQASKIIYSSLSSLGKDFECSVYLTKGKKDAERYIRKYLLSHTESTRFYACGGDGTVNEVVNGIAMFPQASMTVYPCGSGNDFVKCFGNKESFLDIAALTDAKEIPLDVMKVNDRFCINICHFGFDSYVAKKMDEVRSKRIIGGKNAYTTGVVMGLAKAMKNHAEIIADGEVMCNGDFLLCTVANGRYVGGKYKCAPKAMLNDGLLDICVSDTVSRAKFIRLVEYYAQGTHLTDPRFKNFLHYRQCRHVEIKADDGFCISLDGEVVPMSNAVIDVVPNGIKFAVPQKLLSDKLNTALV